MDLISNIRLAPFVASSYEFLFKIAYFLIVIQLPKNRVNPMCLSTAQDNLKT